MQTVNGVVNEPKYECFACKNDECTILKETYCKRSDKCGFYKTQWEHDADLRKANHRLKSLGAAVSGKYKQTQKNNRVSGN